MNKHTSTHPETGDVATRNSKNGTYTHAVWVRRSDELIAKHRAAQVAHLREQAKRHQDEYDELVARWGNEQVDGWIASTTAQADRLETTEPESDEWGVITWCGRLDLAEKQAAKWTKPGKRATLPSYDEVLIVPAVIL